MLFRAYGQREAGYATVAITVDGPTRTAVRFGLGLDGTLPGFVQRNNDGANLFFRPGECRDGVDPAKAGDADINALNCLWVDIDPRPTETPAECRARVDVLCRELEAVGYGPDIVVSTGGGVQLHWFTRRLTFNSPDSVNRVWASGLLKRLAHALGGDIAATNVSRLLRLPGTMNLPTKSKRTKGRVPAPATLVSARPYDPARRSLETPKAVEAFVAALAAWAAEHGYTPELHKGAVASGAGGHAAGPTRSGEKGAEHPALPEWAARALLRALGQMRNDLDRGTWANFSKAIALCCRETVGDEAVFNALHEFQNREEGRPGTADPEALQRVLAEDEPPAHLGLHEAVHLMRKHGWAEGVSFLAKLDFTGVPINDNDMPGSTERCPRPVLLQDADIAAVLDAFEASVIERCLPLYQRGGPVMAARSRYRDRCGREASASGLHMMTVANLTEFASRHFDVRRPGRKGTEVPAVLAHQIASAYLDRGQWSLPTIGALVQAPALARSGRIVSAQGFDPESGVYLADTLPGFVPPDPAHWQTEADAQWAARQGLDTIATLFSHYRFATAADRSVALAALLTPFAVHAGVRGPLFAFNGTGPGVGKSKLVDAIAVLLTGARAQSMTQGVSAAEFEKHLFGKVLEGAALLNIDNVEQPLEGDTLNAVLTQERLSIRPLGTSRTVTVEHRLTLYATGNNLVVRGDMARRVLTCRIDPGVERPELRTFPFDPAERAAAERAAIVGAALTVLAAHAHCGFPGLERLPSAYGSFEEWSRYVRAALVWLGEADPLDVTVSLREADPVLTRLGAVLSALAAVFGYGAPFGARDILPSPASDDFEAPSGENVLAPRQMLRTALQEALAEERIGRGVADAAAVGRYLGKHEGRVVDGLRLDRARNDAKRGHLYRVSRAIGINLTSAGGSGG
ncbi:DNA-primase RepB domain-containing protein [Methylorubrum populi]|uniref:DNA-primase RepB domain-containing protein n=1 Tax=Methylorubrum populi TaxID=223967 RepID=UPI001644185E|nr:DNA-primase RepB domain-containing protein [Methylorubrum populi]